MMRRVLALLLLVLGAGCGWTSTDPDFAGTRYFLQSVLGQLPYPVGGGTTGFTEITTGHILTNDDGTCAASQTLRTTNAGIVIAIETTAVTCTWAESDTDLTFTFPEGVVGTGILVGGTLAIDYVVPPTNAPSEFLYERSIYVRF